MFASTVLFTECQIQLFHWTFPSHGNTAMLCWLWKKTDFMFIALFWGCCPKYSPRCLLRNSKRKQPKKFLFRKKKSAEIKEMLLVIYPTSAKPIDESNYAFLLDLPKEYMMSEKCENYLISRLSTPDYYYTTCACGNRRPGREYVNKGDCLELLVIAQDYGLNRLECECVERAKDIQFSELKKDNNFDKVSAANYRQIVEGMLQGQPF